MDDSKVSAIKTAIRQVLVHDWNPLKAQDGRAYEADVEPVYQMLLTRCTMEQMADYLEKAKISFGIPAFPRARERKAARKLIEINVRDD